MNFSTRCNASSRLNATCSDLPMTITLNGAKRDFAEPLTLSSLLEIVGLAGKPVVVEHNQVALLPREILTAEVNEGDVIEVVQITAGG